MVGNPEVILLTVDNLVLRRSASNGINTSMRHTRDLTDEQWQALDPLIPMHGRRFGTDTAATRACFDPDH